MKSFFLIIIFAFTSIMGIQFSADEIIEKAIKKAGDTRFDNAVIHFTFRGTQYRSDRDRGMYSLEKIKQVPSGMIRDVLNNTGFTRTIDNCAVKVADSLSLVNSESINSVHYFVNLPYGLNALPVRKTLVGESIIKGNSYYKIKVTFDKQGGGVDFNDVFIYWVHKDNFTVDYLAYQYTVNGGGLRFREAYNPRFVNGIRFVDYNNYKTDDKSISLNELDDLFNKKKLKLLSKIITENVYVYVKD